MMRAPRDYAARELFALHYAEREFDESFLHAFEAAGERAAKRDRREKMAAIPSTRYVSVLGLRIGAQ